MKRLIVDRGFLDGKAISICKEQYGIDILIPIRHNMDIYEDAMALFRAPDIDWVRIKELEVNKPACPSPKAIVKREKK